MKLIPIMTSTAIKEIGWQSLVGLIVRFKRGTVWAYVDVQRSTFDEIMAADSKGSAFDRLVKKKKFVGIEITEEELASIVADVDDGRKFSLHAFLMSLHSPVRQSAHF